MTPTPARSAYCVGIGGIGVSSLAQWLTRDGWKVQGADRVRSTITDALQRAGIPVAIVQGGLLPADTALLVYSDAVPPQHALRVEASKRGVRAVAYAELLGELTRPFRTVAVSGSHGKSTTTALVGLLLEAAGRDPTVVVGTRVPPWEGAGLGNFRGGASPIAVVEADEYRKHFLALTPSVAVVTSVDHDHVDAFPTPADYAAAFAEFVRRVPAGGTVVLSASDPSTPVLSSAVTHGASVLTFSIHSASGVGNAEVVASPPTVAPGRQEFSLTVGGEDWGRFSLYVPGIHMVSNVAAAVAAVSPFRVTPAVVRKALAEFRGTWRRFERVGAVNGAPLISDYAHHPTELRALAAAARQWYPAQRLVIVFQPHQRARVRAFSEQFVEALEEFDAVILAEVYDVAGREDVGDETTTRSWVERLRAKGRNVTYAADLADVAGRIRSLARPHDVILVVGAGDIDTVARSVAASHS